MPVWLDVQHVRNECRQESRNKTEGEVAIIKMEARDTEAVVSIASEDEEKTMPKLGRTEQVRQVPTL